jgi:hypothetical protein
LREIILSYDTRDNIFNPTKGTVITFNGDLAGGFIGGEHDYYMMQIGATKFWTFFKKHLLEAKIRLGTADAIGGSDEVPVFDRFSARSAVSITGVSARKRQATRSAANPSRWARSNTRFRFRSSTHSKARFSWMPRTWTKIPIMSVSEIIRSASVRA